MSEDGPQPKKRSRRWRWVVVVALGAAAWLIFSDEALKPVDDLMPRRPEIAWDDNNGWKRLEEFALGLPKLNSKRQSQWWTWTKEAGTAPPPEWARELTLDVSHLPTLEAIAAVPLFQEREYEFSPESGPPGDAAILNLRTRFQILMLSATEENKTPLVLRLWKLSAALQRKITGGAASSYIWSIGSRWVDAGLTTRSLARLDWTEAELNNLASMLGSEHFLPEGGQEAANHDFRRFYNYILNSQGFPDTAIAGESHVGSTFLYQKHRTANRLADQFRVARDLSATHSSAEIQKKQWECASAFPPFLDPNLRGTQMLTGGPVYFSSSSYHGGRATWQTIQVLVALQRCLKVRGALPARLEEMVPEFLPAVPEDPYSGGPLSWDPLHRAVQNTGGEGIIRPVDPKQTRLISEDYRTFLFRTKAEAEARRAGL